MAVRKTERSIASPFLTQVSLREDAHGDAYPFAIPAIANGIDLEFKAPVTFFVGENGSGKSTLLEAIAWSAGYAAQGGGKEHRNPQADDAPPLATALKLIWRQKAVGGFFLRAETFYNFATYLEQSGSLLHRFGGKSLHHQSHGESFLSLFTHRFADGLFILDEPEAALSPQRQLTFLSILHDLARRRVAQFLIATHSPMLLALPGATVLSLDGDAIEAVDYRETQHYLITKNFLDAPERFFQHLLDADL